MHTPFLLQGVRFYVHCVCVCYFNVACWHSPMLLFEDLSLGKLFFWGGKSALMTGPWLAFGSRLVEFV